MGTGRGKTKKGIMIRFISMVFLCLVTLGAFILGLGPLTASSQPVVLTPGISKGDASIYYGEICWQVAETGDPDTSIFKLAVSNMGGGHLIFNGKEVNSQGDFDFYIIHGNGEVISSSLILTLNASGDDEEETEVTTYHVTLSLGSLNGTYNEIWKFYDKLSKQMITGHASGTFTRVSCP